MGDFFPLWAFITLMVSTPGPANLLMMTAGASFGFSKSLPFLAGLIAGKIALNAGIALGLGGLAAEFPLVATAFSYLSAAYIIYLAAKGWDAAKGANAPENPLSFKHGAIVHPMSPKSWVMCTLAYTQFSDGLGGGIEKAFAIAASFMVAQLVFHSLWCVSGAFLGKALNHSAILNRSLIILTTAVVLWAVFK